MRITLQSDDELLLEDSGRGLVAFGALAVAVSLIVGGAAVLDGKPVVALIVLGAFGVAGVYMLRAARAQTHQFDLRRGTLTIASRPAIARGMTTVEVATYPLASLADVVLEESPSANGGRTHSYTYRLAYVFADGARRPLRSYYTSGRAGYAKLQEHLRAVLERARRS